MDSSNLKAAAQVDEPPSMDGDDWRNQLPPQSRQRIVNKILETLKRHVPYSDQEGLEELRKNAIRLEEEGYSVATTQNDYLRKISLKMLTMDYKQNTLPSNESTTAAAAAADVKRNPHEPSASIEEDVDSCA